MDIPPPKTKQGILHALARWYAEYERPIASLSLVGGFIFNALFLTRVDLFWENFWIILHILLAMVCIVIIRYGERHSESDTGHLLHEYEPARLHFWALSVLQFMFGGLLSTFIVFYFRSAVLSVSWPFFVLLGAAFILNERLKTHHERLAFHSSFLALSVLLFSIYFGPVLLHEASTRIFLASTTAGLAVTLVFFAILRRISGETRSVMARYAALPLVALYILLNGLYVLDIIPPLPLALEDGGIYTGITRTQEGYVVTTEEPLGLREQIREFITGCQRIHIPNGAPVYAFSALFSPSQFSSMIVHDWQYKDATGWHTYSTVRLGTIGGRTEGYRTYSIQTGLKTGSWRVSVHTLSGQTLGRLCFSVEEATAPVQTKTLIK
jgi:hypothetical protein